MSARVDCLRKVLWRLRHTTYASRFQERHRDGIKLKAIIAAHVIGMCRFKLVLDCVVLDARRAYIHNRMQLRQRVQVNP
eukprot:2881768-Amphidinium_carterae.1